MSKVKKFILIGNYPKDRQESMERFAQMLGNGFKKNGYKVEIWKPLAIFGSYSNQTTSGIGKWLGYVDKWLVFPIILNFRVLARNIEYTHFHVCDHSNAPSLKCLPKEKTAITCHDVLAIRGALGFADAYCPASKFGKLLQKWILQNLRDARSLAAVSQLTLNQLQQLAPSRDNYRKNWKVIYNAFNADFGPIDEAKKRKLISEAGIKPHTPFILHVGSSLGRKNRKLLLDMVAQLGDKWEGTICFAGKPIDEKLRLHAEKLELWERVISVIKPAHTTLVALYNACDAFVFPSFSEGFGWPVIEAQACGAPVIASNIEPLPEVCGGGALYADPSKPKEFADAFLSLKNSILKNKITENGFKNCARFNVETIIKEYENLHTKNLN